MAPSVSAVPFRVSVARAVSRVRQEILPKFNRIGLATTVALAFAGTGIALTPGTAAAADWPAEVNAVYTIQHPRASGSFRFSAKVRNGKYRATGVADAYIVGLFPVTATLRSQGRIASSGPRPTNYSMNVDLPVWSDINVAMRYRGRTPKVTRYEPPIKPSASRVPVTDEMLPGTIDPIAAIVALGRPRSQACSGTLKIFNGKERLDLKLSLIERTRLTANRREGLSATGYRCRVRYIPHGGHSNNSQIRILRNTSEIQVWLAKSKSNGLFIPYRIQFPTTEGMAALVLDQTSVKDGGRLQVAFVR